MFKYKTRKIVYNSGLPNGRYLGQCVMAGIDMELLCILPACNSQSTLNFVINQETPCGEGLNYKFNLFSRYNNTVFYFSFS